MFPFVEHPQCHFETKIAVTIEQSFPQALAGIAEVWESWIWAQQMLVQPVSGQ
jgi:hypothetical protein